MCKKNNMKLRIFTLVIIRHSFFYLIISVIIMKKNTATRAKGLMCFANCCEKI